MTNYDHIFSADKFSCRQKQVTSEFFFKKQTNIDLTLPISKLNYLLIVLYWLGGEPPNLELEVLKVS